MKGSEAPVGRRPETPAQSQAQPAVALGEAEAADKMAPSRRLIKRRGSGYTPSIKDAISGNFSEEKKEESAIEKMKYYSGEQLHEPFTQEEFAFKWTEYLDSRLSERPSLKACLSRTPQLMDGFKLKLEIDSDMINNEVSKIKPDLVSWLRKELRNTAVELFTEIVETDSTTNRPYSETERFADMLKKNPHLAVLKQKFNLDFSEH